MFKECKKLKEIKGINQFITKNVTKMNKLFYECINLENLDLSNFDTSNVTDMAGMFYKCNKIKEIKGIEKLILIKLPICIKCLMNALNYNI